MISVRNQIGGLGNLLFKQAYIIGKVLDYEIPDVYVQGEKYWVKHKQLIKEAFGQNIGEYDKVGIHVRRGDYVGSDFHILLGEEYYKAAMAHFPNEKFIVFSDDIAWCQTQEIFSGCEFSIDKTEIGDLNLMASCKGLIMANSSFSWWGAYLKDKTVVCPKDWFYDGVERIELLDSWIKI